MRNRVFLFGVLSVVSLYLIFFIVGIGCPIKFLTGISCAGCGMTRAWINVFRLDFTNAFKYHPLFILPLVFAVIYLLRGRINKRLYNVVATVFIATFIIVYLIRMFNQFDMIVVFDIENGMFFKIIKLISRGMQKW